MQRPLLLVEDSDPDSEALLRVARKLPLSAPVVRSTTSSSGGRTRRLPSRCWCCWT
ncbi:MAG TPA: hypothetical protein VFZ09_46240 [Archangium sp.]|uniref:hypothetical protein n=1 Tax=Archangium sp. TaxID=1872627 RepID=UPI002E34EAA3|nr:hypothetical protein [Archangium sp.]HEX5753678.1 hypothetical protein [Archangium sp.]